MELQLNLWDLLFNLVHELENGNIDSRFDYGQAWTLKRSLVRYSFVCVNYESDNLNLDTCSTLFLLRVRRWCGVHNKEINVIYACTLANI